MCLTGDGSGSQYQTNESSSEALVLFRDTALASVSAGLVTACAERSLLISRHVMDLGGRAWPLQQAPSLVCLLQHLHASPKQRDPAVHQFTWMLRVELCLQLQALSWAVLLAAKQGTRPVAA
jgi:hypothetical protein